MNIIARRTEHSMHIQPWVEEDEVHFYGAKLRGFKGKDGVIHIAVKPMARHMGVDEEGTRQLIKRHPILDVGTCMIQAPSESGDQTYPCLPLELIPGYLFLLDVSR